MVEMYIRRLAGFMILLGLALYYYVDPLWLILPGFVAINLIQSSFTKWCPAEKILKKIFK